MIRHPRELRLPLPLVGAALHPFFRMTFNPRLPYRVQRALLDGGSRLQALPAGTVVESGTLGGRPAERITAGRAATFPVASLAPASDAVLYLHGGGYTIGSLATHRSLAAHLARETGAAVYLLDYRLAPEHVFPAALEDGVAAFVDLVENDGYSPDRIAVAGDSAGGGLALATTRRLVDRDLSPVALAMISPWSDPEDVAVPTRDRVVSAAWGRANAAAYLGDGDPRDPGYAPLHGNLAGLPPTLIQVGTRELLHSQCLRLAQRMRAAGVDVTCSEHPRLWHDAQLQATLVREAAEAVAEIGTFLRTRSEAVATEPGRSNVG